MFSKWVCCFSKPKTTEPVEVPVVKASDYKIPVHFSPYLDEPKTTPFPKRKRVQTYADEEDMTITYLPPTAAQTRTEMPSIPVQSHQTVTATDKPRHPTLRELAPLNLISLNQTHPTDMDYTFIAPIVPPKISDDKVANLENSVPDGGAELYRLDMNGTELHRTDTIPDATMSGAGLYRTDNPDADMELNRPYVTSDKKPEFDELASDSDKMASASLSFASPYITPGQVSLRKVFSGTRYDDFYGPISRV